MSHSPIAAGKSSFDLIEVATLLSVLNVSDNTVFVDIACGAGNYAIEIARQIRQPGRVYAFDLWEEGIDQLKRKADSLGLSHVRAQVCDVSQTLPLDDRCADVCLMATVLHDLIHDGTHQGALVEVDRVLRPTGRLAVIEFKKKPGPPGPPEKVRLSPQDVRNLLQPMGFRQAQTADLGAEIYLSVFRKSYGTADGRNQASR